MNENFYTIVDSLIKLNEDNMRRQRDYLDHMYPTARAVEFATVKVDMGRQVGKTSYIADNAGRGDLVIVGTHEDKRSFKNCKARILSAQEVFNGMNMSWHGLCKCDYNRIWIDEPRRVFGRNSANEYLKNLELFYIYFGDRANQFILLGATL